MFYLKKKVKKGLKGQLNDIYILVHETVFDDFLKINMYLMTRNIKISIIYH